LLWRRCNALLGSAGALIIRRNNPANAVFTQCSYFTIFLEKYQESSYKASTPAMQYRKGLGHPQGQRHRHHESDLAPYEHGSAGLVCSGTGEGQPALAPIAATSSEQCISTYDQKGKHKAY
jgi:hypothetical protein